MKGLSHILLIIFLFPGCNSHYSAIPSGKIENEHLLFDKYVYQDTSFVFHRSRECFMLRLSPITYIDTTYLNFVLSRKARKQEFCQDCFSQKDYDAFLSLQNRAKERRRIHDNREKIYKTLLDEGCYDLGDIDELFSSDENIRWMYQLLVDADYDMGSFDAFLSRVCFR